MISKPTGTTDLGCNPVIPGDADVLKLVEASDNCSLASTNVTHTDDGSTCKPNRVFKIVVADGCGNKTTNTFTYTWTADTIPPVLSNPTGTNDLGCNPKTLPVETNVLPGWPLT